MYRSPGCTPMETGESFMNRTPRCSSSCARSHDTLIHARKSRKMKAGKGPAEDPAVSFRVSSHAQSIASPPFSSPCSSRSSPPRNQMCVSQPARSGHRQLPASFRLRWGQLSKMSGRISCPCIWRRDLRAHGQTTHISCRHHQSITSGRRWAARGGGQRSR
jgi:hypothetical protein